MRKSSKPRGAKAAANMDAALHMALPDPTAFHREVFFRKFRKLSLKDQARCIEVHEALRKSIAAGDFLADSPVLKIPRPIGWPVNDCLNSLARAHGWDRIVQFLDDDGEAATLGVVQSPPGK